ncbi:Smr/MutS family protein [soil metagenome]
MTRRRLRPDEARLWAKVAETVELAPGMSAPEPPPEQPAPPPPKPAAKRGQPPVFTRRSPRPPEPAAAPRPPRPKPAPPEADAIEPNRKRLIVRRADAIEARLDLHGFDQDRAKIALHAFLKAAHANGVRAVLVITGKGSRGGGVLKDRTPEWLADPAVRGLVAGVSTADRRHGGAGALYIALKRRV